MEYNGLLTDMNPANKRGMSKTRNNVNTLHYDVSLF